MNKPEKQIRKLLIKPKILFSKSVSVIDFLLGNRKTIVNIFFFLIQLMKLITTPSPSEQRLNRFFHLTNQPLSKSDSFQLMIIFFFEFIHFID